MTSFFTRVFPTCLFLFLFLRPAGCLAGPPVRLTIEEVYLQAREHYPLSRQRQLVRQSMEYSVENASRGFLPQLNIAGQATLQSDVTNFPFKIPIAGFSLPAYSKDQYKAYGEVDQLIYDGGLIRNQKQSAVVNELIQEKNLDVELYALYDRVNQLFFGVLLIEEQLKQNELLQADIQNGVDKTRALVEQGTAVRSSVDELEAQLLQAVQTRVQELSARRAYLAMLGLFLDRPLDETTVLMSPPEPLSTDLLDRPELLLYEYQKKNYDLQDALAKAQLRPRFSLFFQGGYGRPGLNMLSNDFALYYIGGLRLNWNLGGLYTLKNQKRISELGRRTQDVDKETFIFNTGISQRQFREDIVQFEELGRTDDRIIGLRNSVKNAAAAQLANGVLSAHDYLTQVDAEDQARENRILHRVQLLQAEYNYKNLMGH
ncbi:MAG: TolC family protein [Puia sp.]|nr:TolC family protein [Puia sp.]